MYEPATGEVPVIKGDQAIFFVCNDKGGLHTESGGAALGIEIQAMAYAYKCKNDSALFNTVFTNYRIINKSSFVLDSAFIGNWTDIDIGYTGDDFIGCDVARGAYFGYGGDLIDGPSPGTQLSYGVNPPAQAVVFLKGPFADPNGSDDALLSTPNGTNYGDGIADNEHLGMSRFLNYQNDFSVTGNPVSAMDFYNYIAGNWKDDTSWTYGGNGHLTGVPCHYFYPGASDPSGYGTSMVPQVPWDEASTGNLPSDRRGLGASGPFTFQPGAVQELDFAYVFARATSGGPLASVALMRERIDSVRLHFNAPDPGCACDGLTGIKNISPEGSFTMYPNPTNGTLYIEHSSLLNEPVVRIYDMMGQLVKQLTVGGSKIITVETDGLKPGVYLLSIYDADHSFARTFIRE
jgi:hypothetical protein